MLSNAARFLMVSAAASLVALGSAPAEACSAVADVALSLIENQVPTGNGASFFTLAMKTQSGYTSSDIAQLWGSTSPDSHRYYNQIIAENHFTHITNVALIDAGDVLAIDEVWNESGVRTYAGHTVIVTGPAEPITAMSPLVSGTVQYALPIADATSSVHGCSVLYPDSRWPNGCTSGSFTGGAGTAFLRIYADAETGELQGYSWSVTSGSAYYAPDVRPYAVGRLTSCFPTPNDP